VVRGPSPGALLVLADGKLLTRPHLTSSLSAILSKAGVDSSCYNTHSFCIGAVTSAKEAGISDSQVEMLGRWKSRAFQQYICTPREKLANLSKALATIK